MCIVQVARVAQLHVLYDVLRVSHHLTPTHTEHTDGALGHGAWIPNFHTQFDR